MLENNMLECVKIDAEAEVTTLEYGFCSIEIHRRVVGSEVNYEAFADFRGDEESGLRFDYEMNHVTNIYSDGGALSGDDDHVHLECSYNPRDVIENYLGRPKAVWLGSNH